MTEQTLRLNYEIRARLRLKLHLQRPSILEEEAMKVRTRPSHSIQQQQALLFLISKNRATQQNSKTLLVIQEKCQPEV